MTRHNEKGLLRDRRGAVGAWSAIMLVMLLGVAAFPIDMGFLWVLRDRLQATADASALAGASQLTTTPDPASVKAEAIAYAQKNMPPGGHGTVLADADVVLGHWHGKENHAPGDPDLRTFVTNATGTAAPAGETTNAVQVTTRRAEANGNAAPLFLAPLLGLSQADVVAQAIAVMPYDLRPYCVMALDPSADRAIEILSSDTDSELELEECGVKVNSSSADAFFIQGGSEVEVRDSTVSIVGDVSSAGGGDLDVDPGPPETGAMTALDPYLDLEVPSYSGCDFSNETVTTDATISPGVYCGGLTISGDINVTVEPGIYIIDGGDLRFEGDFDVDGVGVSFVLTSSTENDYGRLIITENGAGDADDIDLTAPTTGPMAGVLFYQDRNAPSIDPGTGLPIKNLIQNDADLEVMGVLYFPSQELELSDDAEIEEDDGCVQIIVRKLTLIDDSEIDIRWRNDFECGNAGLALVPPPRIWLVN